MLLLRIKALGGFPVPVNPSSQRTPSQRALGQSSSRSRVTQTKNSSQIPNFAHPAWSVSRPPHAITQPLAGLRDHQAVHHFFGCDGLISTRLASARGFSRSISRTTAATSSPVNFQI